VAEDSIPNDTDRSEYRWIFTEGFFCAVCEKADLGIVRIIRSKMESNDDFKLPTAA
jgi:hypothetical protein